MRFRKTLWFLVLSLSVVALSLAVTSWQSVPSGSNPRGIAVGDVDKDGVADLVVANFGAPSFIGQDMKDAKPGTLQVFTASGSSLALKAETEVGIGPRGVAVMPNGSVVVSLYGEDLLKVYRYKSGKLTLTQSVATSVRPVGLAVGNGVVAVASYGDSKVCLFPMDNDDKLGARVDVATLPGTTAVAIGALSSKALPDVAVACLSSDKILILSAEGGEVAGYKVATTLSLPQGQGPADLRLEDIDGDGLTDIAAVLFGGKGVAVFPGRSGGEFGDPVITKLAGACPNGLSVVRQEGAPPLVAVAERDSDLIETFVWKDGRLELSESLPLEATPSPMGPVEVVGYAPAGKGSYWVASHMRSGTLRVAQRAVPVAASSALVSSARVVSTPVAGFAPLSDQTLLVYPNPYRGKGKITIQFSLDALRTVDIRVFDLVGRQVWSTTVMEGSLSLGENRLTWDALGASKAPLASGAYVCRVASGGQVATKKVFIVR